MALWCSDAYRTWVERNSDDVHTTPDEGRRPSWSISLFEWPEWSPSKSNAGGRHAKAEASFAHSKRCREVRLLLETLRLRHARRCHDARSVWSARSLLPLCDETTKTIRRAICFPRFKSTFAD